jgi:hypothetical protein
MTSQSAFTRFMERERVVVVLTLCAGVLFFGAALAVVPFFTIRTGGQGLTLGDAMLLATAATLAIFVILTIANGLMLAYQFLTRGTGEPDAH